jgi:hydrogenase nickel incorporation protein HypA/HybF
VHEFSLAKTIVTATLAELKKRPAARLRTVRVVIGRQHAVVPENLRFAFATLIRETPARGARLAIRTRPIAIRCRKCGWKGAVKAPLYLCKSCGAGAVEVTGGNELYLQSLEVETDA